MKIKKLIAAVLIICTVLPSLFVAINADENIFTATFVALGDSIAYGYALENKDEERYSTLIGKEIGVEVINHAVSGMTSDNLILALNSGAYDESLLRSNHVSVSIGSNDLLSPFTKIFSDALSTVSLSVDNIGSLMTDQSKINEVFVKINTALTDNEILLKACDDFYNKLSTIVGILNKKAPDAELYLNNIYNPYANVVIKNPLTGVTLIDLGAYGDYYINKFNSNFDKKSYSYTLIDLYTPFNEGKLTNVNINLLDFTSMSLDPHPNAEGHKVIATALLNIIGIMPRPVDIEGHWGEPYIMAMIHKGLFSEIISDHFYPESPMSRGMFVTILGRLLNVNASIYTANNFNDITKGDYFWQYVSWASYHKIVLGTGDRMFEPNLPITREEMAVILQRCIKTFGLAVKTEITEITPFNDAASISPWAIDAVSLMQTTGLYKGDENNNVTPQATIINAEVVTILYRFDDNTYTP